MYLENRHLITAYPCFEADNDSAEPANQNTKIDSNTALILFISPLYKPLHVTRQWYARAVYITPRGNQGWLLNSVEWTSCTNPEGKLKIAMTKRDVAVTHKVVTNFLSSQTRQSFFMNNRHGCCNKCTCK